MTTPSFITRFGFAWIACIVLVASTLAPAQTTTRLATPDSSTTRNAVEVPPSFVLHLPGIGGKRGLDRALIRGLTEGGLVQTETYDWTANDPGLNALLATERNRKQAKHVAEIITDVVRKQPGVRVHLIAHSGGTGIAAWALESLPPDVRIYNLVLLASALSPDYDLSKALSHVEHKAYAFTSTNDSVILKVGTQMFGTIDGKKVAAAGWGGFLIPAAADLMQYAKFIQYPYDPAWMQFDNRGDHIGPMRTAFARFVLAPLLASDIAPPRSAPTTGPAKQRSYQE